MIILMMLKIGQKSKIWGKNLKILALRATFGHKLLQFQDKPKQLVPQKYSVMFYREIQLAWNDGMS